MILQRPKRKKGKPVKKSSTGSNPPESLTTSHVLPGCSLQVIKHKADGRDCATRDTKPKAPRKPAPSRDRSGNQSGPWPGPPRGPILAPGFPPRGPMLAPGFPPRGPILAPGFPPSRPLLAPPVPHPIDNHGGEGFSTVLHQQPALYDLISSKFDAVITSIDEENFSGDRRELGK